MPAPLQPRDLSLHELQDHCAQETTSYFLGFVEEAWHCYEIFRRAIVDKNEAAWDVIDQQYRNQIRRWVEHHPRFHNFPEDADVFVNWVFEKFWRRNLSAVEFAQFSNLRKLLTYLKMIVASVVTDYWRGQMRQNVVYWDEVSHLADRPSNYSPQERLDRRLEAEEFWNDLRMKLGDETAFGILYASFVLGLKPVDIYELSPELYGDIKEVYRIKARAMNLVRNLL